MATAAVDERRTQGAHLIPPRSQDWARPVQRLRLQGGDEEGQGAEGLMRAAQPRFRAGKRLALPADAITQTFGILAVRGAGKSNLGAVMAEEMFAAKLPFVVVDPVGSWWGLRSSGDGKGAGVAVPIFGGAHGDVPLEGA